MEDITRRDFVKLTALVGAGIAISQIPGKETLLKEVTAAEAEVLKAEAEQEKTVLGNFSLCGFGGGAEPCAVDVKNGRIIRVRPLHLDWKYKPEELKLPTIKARGKIFTMPHLKALATYLLLSYKKRAYTPNRVKYPLKRVDFDPKAAPDKRNQQNRGVSGFVRISWDEALDIIESEIKRIKETYGLYSALVFSDGHGQGGPIHTVHGYAHTIFPLLGGETSAVRNPDSWEGWYYGARHTWGFPAPTGQPTTSYVLEDYLENTELFIYFGDHETTPCWTSFQGNVLFRWLREAGIRVIWTTPEFNYSGAAHAPWVEGGKWIPVLPNTDAALYLAIAHVWITEERYDKGYVATHTYGFEEFKKYVLGEEDGVPKTPKWAEPITGIPARTIKALAREWASKRTSMACNVGSPHNRSPYGSEPARLAACLLGMQGLGKPGVQFNFPFAIVDLQDPEIAKLLPMLLMHPSALPTGTPYVLVPAPVPGGGVGAAFVPKTIAPYAVLNPPVSWYSTAAFAAPKEDQFVMYTFPAPGYPELHMIWNENTCLSACWQGSFHVEAFRSPRIEFYVGMGPWLENDLLFADLILPNQTVLEHTDLASSFTLQSYLYYCEKAIEPIGESKSNYEVYCMIAERFGVLDKFTGGKTPEEWFKAWFGIHLASKYMSWDEFVEKKYFLSPFPTPEEWETIKKKYNLKPGLRWYWELPEGKGMGGADVTPTGKIEFSSVNLAKYADLEIEGVKFKDERPPVPHYIPYGDSYQDSQIHPRAKEYPLLLESNHPRWRGHVQMDDATWLREIPTCKIRGPDGYLYEPVWLNPVEAAKRGIKHGDIVKVYNDRGAVLGAAYITGRVPPRMAYMDHGARIDPIAYDEKGGVLIDRGGSNNLLAPGVSKTYPLMCVSGYLVEVEKVDIFELMKQYPDGFKRKLDPDVGPYYDTWVH